MENKDNSRAGDVGSGADAGKSAFRVAIRKRWKPFQGYPHYEAYVRDVMEEDGFWEDGYGSIMMSPGDDTVAACRTAIRRAAHFHGWVVSTRRFDGDDFFVVKLVGMCDEG